MRTWRHTIGRTAALSAVLGLCLSATLLLSGCLFIGQQLPSNGWTREPRDLVDDWRRVDMQSLMAYSDTWFTVDGNQRGIVKGYATGGMAVNSTGGFFELGIIYRVNNVPVQQSARIYFDKSTPVYANGARAGTVLEGITTENGYDITQGGRILEVPFHINGGRMYAERVTVSDQTRPLVP